MSMLNVKINISKIRHLCIYYSRVIFRFLANLRRLVNNKCLIFYIYIYIYIYINIYIYKYIYIYI